ncbi:MAG: succinate dehydrogenase assembly factor 2 [Thiothrix sp.]
MSELSRLKLRCRRGMKELDVIFQHYLKHHYPNASLTERQYLNELLDLQDPVLFNWVLGIDTAPAEYQDLLTKLRHAHD